LNVSGMALRIKLSHCSRLTGMNIVQQNSISRLNKMLKHAIRVSELSEYKFQLGAVIFRKNQIISLGFNKNKTHPLPNRYNKHGTIHAEVDAILHADPDLLSGSSILVCRHLKNGSPAMAKPCKMCERILFDFGIRDVYWTTNSTDLGREYYV